MNTPTTTRKAPMDLDRKRTLAAGLLYLATFVFSIPAAFGLYHGVLNDPSAFVLGAGSSTSVAWGALFEIITALAGIATAVVLYPVLKRYGPVGAMGFVTSRVIEAAMIFVGILALLSVVTLRQDFTGGDVGSLTTAAHSLVALKDWTFLLGPGIMPAINALCFATILYRSRLVPRIIPAIGLVGAPLLLAAAMGILFGRFDQVSTPAALLTMPIAAWEFTIGVWMIVKGFRSTRTVDETPVVSLTPVPVLSGVGV